MWIATNVANSAASASSLAVTIPATAQPGDLVLLPFIWSGGSATATVSSSAGSALTAQIAPTPYTVLTVGLWSLICSDADAGSTVTITNIGSARVAGAARVDRGITAVDTVAVTGSSATGTTITAPSVTPGAGNISDQQVIFYGGYDSTAGGTNAIGTPTGFTPRSSVRTIATSGVRNVNLAGADRQLSSAEATGTATTTSSLAISPFGMAVLLIPADAPPTANAGADQDAAPGATVTLAGSGTDPAGQALTYSWSQLSGPAVTLSSATVAQPTFAAPSLVGGATLVFGLVVTDTSGQPSAQDAVTVTVSPAPYLLRREGGAWVRRRLRRRINGVWV